MDRLNDSLLRNEFRQLFLQNRKDCLDKDNVDSQQETGD